VLTIERANAVQILTLLICVGVGFWFLVLRRPIRASLVMAVIAFFISNMMSVVYRFRGTLGIFTVGFLVICFHISDFG
jgi:hypothetical protein